ncbi:EamA family transporter [Clostridium fermenticellae]|uniref:EamA family transporter n=1 Tax=Clostridium fermenticellae TaxID=2068654 RepID=A0A386H502_9CLOT|nr:DMT family transporter [Clostridium fermenticellae]AYD40740.1 EamA family transporter [Clostridium fermenticellae]
MKSGYIDIFLSTILFSTMEIALKLISNQFNPIQLTFLRFLIGGLILLPLALKNTKNGFKKEDIKFFAFQGFICVVISMVFFQLAVQYGKASIVAILFSCNPVFVVLLAYFIINEKIYKSTIVSLVISILGMLCIMNPMNMTNNIYSVVFAILAAATFALYGVTGKKKSKEYGGIAQSSFSFIMGSCEMLIIMLITKIGFVSNFLSSHGLKMFSDIPILKGITLQSLPSLIYVGVFVTGLGYTFYFLAMEKTTAATASLVFYIKPALAPILALLILKEYIAINTIIGIILIIISSAITFVCNNKRAKQIKLKEETENGKEYA